MFKKGTVLVLLGVLGLMAFALPGVGQQAANKPIVIYYLVGGPAGESYATVKYNGAMAAQEILGDKVDVRVMWGTWNPQNDADLFQKAMAAHPDGIAVMGWDAVRPFIPDAIKQGIVVALHNVDATAVREQYGLGYVGQLQYDSGYTLGKAAVQRAGLEKGDRAMVWGLLNQPERGQRTKGVVDALQEKGIVVDSIEITPEVNSDPIQGVPVITAYLARHPECKLVVTDHGGMTATQEQYFKAAGLGPNDIYGAGFDVSPATAAAIQSGYTDLVLDQQPFLQGFLPIFQIYLTKQYAFSGLFINTGAGLIDSSNIDVVAPLANKGIR